MMAGNFDEISNLYSEYIKKTNEDRLDAGDLLWKAGTKLLEINTKNINIYEDSDREVFYNKRFFLAKIAGDLLRLYQDMAHTKFYDTSPKLREYVYLAFDLADEFFDQKADRQFLPFLYHVMYYKSYNEDKGKFNKISNLYKDSLKLEREYLDKLLNTDDTLRYVNIHGF